MSPAACEIMNSHKTFHDYRQLHVITENDYDYIKFGESVITITIMITQKMQSITIDYNYNRNQPQPCCKANHWFSKGFRMKSD